MRVAGHVAAAECCMRQEDADLEADEYRSICCGSDWLTALNDDV